MIVIVKFFYKSAVKLITDMDWKDTVVWFGKYTAFYYDYLDINSRKHQAINNTNSVMHKI